MIRMILLLYNSIIYIFKPYAQQTADITRKALWASAATLDTKTDNTSIFPFRVNR